MTTSEQRFITYEEARDIFATKADLAEMETRLVKWMVGYDARRHGNFGYPCLVVESAFWEARYCELSSPLRPHPQRLSVTDELNRPALRRLKQHAISHILPQPLHHIRMRMTV